MLTLHRYPVRWLAILAVLLIASAFGATAPVPLPPGVTYVTSVEGISEYRLQNGLRVLLFPDPTKTNITVNITYLVGSRHEDYGETGMAHLLEHLLFKGSTNHPDIPKELRDHGCRPNGTTWVDRTNYYETFFASDENLRWALELEADRMVNSFIAKKDLDSEMTVVRNEWEAGENNPQSVLFQRVTSTAFLWHNYGKSTIGARSDIENVPIERLQAFYRHFYQPDNAVLIVAGKIDEAKTLALVDTIYSPIPKPARQLRRTYTVEPTQDGERTVTLRRVGDVQAVTVAHHIPAGPHAEYAAVQLAAMILGDNPSGRLYKALVVPGKAANTGTFSLQTMDPGLMYAFASVRLEKSLDDAVDTLLGTFAELETKPFTAEEVERARTQWLKGFEMSLNNSEQVALGLTGWQAQGDWRLLFLHRDRMRTVTSAEVQAAALKYFIRSNRTVGRFIPDKQPVRAEIGGAGDLAALLKDYRGDPAVARGEAFEATTANIEAHTQRVDLAGGLKLSLLPKKTRGEQIHAVIDLHFGEEAALRGCVERGNIAAQMLIRGTARHTREQIKDELDRLKAQVSVNGGPAGISARILTDREHFPAVLALVAEVLREPSFPENEFAELRQSALASIENQKSEPGAIASIALQRHAFPYPEDHVRYTPTLEERVTRLTALTLDEVKRFYRDFYGASAGEIAVIGDFDPAAVQGQLEALFGAWKSPRPYTRIENLHQQIAAVAAAYESPDKPNAFWTAVWRVQMNDEHADYPAMVLSSYLIGSGMNSRLFQRIRNKEGLSYGVGAGFSAPTQADGASFRAYAICAPENAPKVEASFKDEIGGILERGFTDEEVAAAKKSWLLSRQVGRAQDAELRHRLNDVRHWQRTLTFDDELERKVTALQPADLQAALNRHLDLARLSIARAGDFKKAGVNW